MKRKLTLAMLLSLSAASPMALALGLGEADVHSTLNAPLRATIPLTDTGGMQAGLLNVSVADERTFSAAGLARTPLAASVRLAVEQREGRLVLDLTTERPVREPWLDLLLHFDWPDGRQLREVTLLLDPPDYDQMPTLIGTPARPEPPSATVSTARSEPESRSRPVARTAAAGDSDDPAWVRSGDTLWAVAGRLRPDSGISMNQMMVALVEANPEVFPSGNINAMRAGFTLVVPGRESITSRSTADADGIVQAMNQAWANRGSGAPARVPLGGSQEVAPEAAVAVTDAALLGTAEPSAAPASEEEPEAAAPAPVDIPSGDLDEEAPRLTLLTDAEVAAEAAPDEDPGEGAGPGEGGAGEEASTTPAARGELDPSLLEGLQGEGELTSDERLIRLEARWLENRQALEVVRDERDALQDELGEMREELAALRDQVAAFSAGGQGVDGPGTGGVVPPGESEQAVETPWWGAFYQGAQDRTLMLGGAALAALLALWALVRRRQRRDETVSTFGQVQRVAPGERVAGPEVAAAATPGGGEAAPVRASMPKAEAIDEADIFIAYGRYDQARELLEASLVREPERDDLRLKLLMVHLEQGDQEQADREASRLRASGDPRLQAEVENLMSRRAAASPAQSAPVEGGRAVFAEPTELPPRRFDDPDEEDEQGEKGQENPAAPAFGGEVPRGVDDMPPGPEGGEDPAAPYRRPEPRPGVDPGRQPEPRSQPRLDNPPEPEPAAEPEHRPASASSPASPDTSPDESRDDAPPSGPPLANRIDDLGRDIIDYRPPTLDPSPSPREETPMQPSVEFSTSGDTGAPAEPAASDDWEVEEVAFPPLDRDNEWLSAGASSSPKLAEARRLLEAGEIDQARPLLRRLADASDDPVAREEARELITRHDL
ncbi:FimV/HubP family polar landmark protein [Halomonas sp. C05BenzN]|uniref:FimV/HubP family polar landmark protein n=1 Tax=Halomonas sp. C05BenzN TaxID=3411041 RepID=UPI003B963A31